MKIPKLLEALMVVSLSIIISWILIEFQRYTNTPKYIHILIFGMGKSFLYYLSLTFGVFISLFISEEKRFYFFIFSILFFFVVICYSNYNYVDSRYPLEKWSYYEIKFFLRLFIKEIWFNFKLYYFWEILLFSLIILSSELIQKIKFIN